MKETHSKKADIANAARAHSETVKVPDTAADIIPETPEEIRDAIVAVLSDKKARNIVSVEVGHLTVVADYFVIADAGSVTAVRALGEAVDERMSAAGCSPRRSEGVREGRWAALDFGSVIVHIFYTATRELYQLEKLWTDGTNITEYV